MNGGKENNINLKKQCDLFSTIVNSGQAAGEHGRKLQKCQHLKPETNSIQISNRAKKSA